MHELAIGRASTTAPMDPVEGRTFILAGEEMLPCTSAGYGAVCGSLEVPGNRSDASSRTIDLEVVVIPAVSDHPAADPVFFLTGGPGGAATEGWASAPSVFPEIHQERDIVLVDQRGTGGSNQLILPPAPDPSGLGREEAYSQLEQYYLRQHEEHVRAVVLDSGTLLDVPIVEMMAARSQEALDEVFDLCHVDEDCHAAHPNTERDLRTALHRLSRDPITTDSVDERTGERIVLTADTLAGRVHELLKVGQSGEIPRLLHLTAEGDIDPLRRLVLAALSEPDPTRLGKFWPIECFEAWAAHEPARMTDLGAGSNFLPAMLGDAENLEIGCGLMPEVPLPENDGTPVRSKRPVLLLNGLLDPPGTLRRTWPTPRRSFRTASPSLGSRATPSATSAACRTS